jgi:hypothetical protein
MVKSLIQHGTKKTNRPKQNINNQKIGYGHLTGEYLSFNQIRGFRNCKFHASADELTTGQLKMANGKKCKDKQWSTKKSTQKTKD